MNTEEQYKLHKGFYEFEFQQKNFIISRLTTAYTVIIIVGGGGAYFLNNFNLYPISTLGVIFLLLFVPFALSLLTVIFYLTKCFFTYEYGYPAAATEFQRYIEDHEKRNKRVAASKKRDIRDKVQQCLSKQYCECATILRRHNKTRIGWFLRAMQATRVAVIFLFIMTPVFYAQKYQSQQKHIFYNEISVQQIKETKAMCDKDKDKDEDVEPEEPKIDRVMENRDEFRKSAEESEEDNNED
ncbi:MAG: hypothetical protein FVQ84_07990 [Planctomycetes bacterium]|nr:hypothetical protein [Planctomycetota bacterium]